MEAGKGSGDRVNPVRMWVGFGLLAVAAGLTAIANREEEAARAIGAGFAPVLIGVILAIVFRLIWARGKADRAFEISGFILCAGITALVAAVLSLAGRAEENEETLDQALRAIEQGTETCPPLVLEDLGGGFEAGPPTPGESRRFGIDPEAASAAAGDLAPVVDDATVSVIRSNGQAAGVVVSIPFDLEAVNDGQTEEEVRLDVLAGLSDGALALDADAEEVTVAGLSGVAYETPAGNFAASTVLDCQAVTTQAFDAQTAVLLAERLIDAQPSR